MFPLLWRPRRALIGPRAVLVLAAAVAVVGFATATACAGALGGATGVTASAATTLVLVQGAGQSAQVGTNLPTPIVLRALDASGVAVPGVTVSLWVASGGGVITPASDTTDAHGEFRAKWTLGPASIAQQIVANAPGVSPVSITATGLLPTQIVLVQGNNQTAKAGAALTNSIIVRVVSGDANIPMQGVTVQFQVLTGGGGMTPLTVVTSALGEASTKWTLGAAGPNTALAVAGKLPPVSLTATATP